MNSRVSVVVPTFNRPNALARALESARRTATPSIEVKLIVVDNGNNPVTPVVASAYGAIYHHVDPAGAAHSRNVGLRLVTTEFVAFLDDDDFWDPLNVTPQIDFLTAHRDFGAALSKIQGVTQDGTALGTPYPRDLPADGYVFESFLRDWTQIGAFVIRSEVARAVGDFDSSVEGGEDWDWVLRLARLSRIGLTPHVGLNFSIRDFADPAILDVDRGRVGCNRRIFWRHARAAHGTFGCVLDTRDYMRFRGRYFGNFVNVARSGVERADRDTVRTALRLALRTSPVHFATRLLTDPSFRSLASGIR